MQPLCASRRMDLGSIPPYAGERHIVRGDPVGATPIFASPSAHHSRNRPGRDRPRRGRQGHTCTRSRRSASWWRCTANARKIHERSDEIGTSPAHGPATPPARRDDGPRHRPGQARNARPRLRPGPSGGGRRCNRKSRPGWSIRADSVDPIRPADRASATSRVGVHPEVSQPNSASRSAPRRPSSRSTSRLDEPASAAATTTALTTALTTNPQAPFSCVPVVP